MATAEVCRRHGINSATFYKWKAKYGGLEVSEGKRLRSLEDENAKLKRLLPPTLLPSHQPSANKAKDSTSERCQSGVHVTEN
jgi:transposase-like protein